MEPEQTTLPVESNSKFENLRKVTPLSKYLAMTLFIILPFLGGWVGYTYAPEKEAQTIEVVGSDFSDAMVIANPSNPKAFMCDHRHLYDDRKIEEFGWLKSENGLEDWPTYQDSRSRISFSYPPHQVPNYDESYTSADGVEHLVIGYNPMLLDTYSGLGKPRILGIDDQGWEVRISKSDPASKDIVDRDICKGTNWCLAETVDFRNNFDTLVKSYYQPGMLAGGTREYLIKSPNDYLVEMQTDGIGSSDLPCQFISNIYNIDPMASSVRLDPAWYQE